MFLQIVCNIVWGMVLVLSVPIGFLSFPLALTLLVRVGHWTSLTFDDSVERLKALLRTHHPLRVPRIQVPGRLEFGDHHAVLPG